MTQPLSSQITDRNFLQANGFSFTVNRAPTLGFFGNAVNVPGLTMNTTVQPNYLRNIPRPGTQLDFNDLTLRFLVDQGLENYIEIQNWLRGIGFPESLSEIYDWQNTGPVRKSNRDEINLTSDGTMTILNGINRPVFSVVFKDLFPTSISDLQFDSQTTDVEYLTAQVTFKYSVYNITDVACC